MGNIQKVRKQQQRSRIDIHIGCFFSFCIFLFLVIFPLFWIGYFPYGFFWLARWCVLLVAWRLYINALSFLFAVVSFLSSFIRQNWRSYSKSDTIVHCSTGIHTVYWIEGSMVNGSKSLKCGHWARLSLSLQQYTPYLQRVDTTNN